MVMFLVRRSLLGSWRLPVRLAILLDLTMVDDSGREQLAIGGFTWLLR